MVQEMSFKDISYLELWQPFCSVERNHLCNFGRGHYEEQFGELFRVQEEMLFKRFIWSSDGPLLFSGAEPFMAKCKSYCWGQDIPNNNFKSTEYIRLSSCIFKMIGPEENMLKISWQSVVPSRSYQH